MASGWCRHLHSSGTVVPARGLDLTLAALRAPHPATAPYAPRLPIRPPHLRQCILDAWELLGEGQEVGQQGVAVRAPGRTKVDADLRCVAAACTFALTMGCVACMALRPGTLPAKRSNMPSTCKHADVHGCCQKLCMSHRVAAAAAQKLPQLLVAAQPCHVGQDLGQMRFARLLRRCEEVCTACLRFRGRERCRRRRRQQRRSRQRPADTTAPRSMLHTCCSPSDALVKRRAGR